MNKIINTYLKNLKEENEFLKVFDDEKTFANIRDLNIMYGEILEKIKYAMILEYSLYWKYSSDELRLLKKALEDFTGFIKIWKDFLDNRDKDIAEENETKRKRKY